jgi:chromosome segregation ATPase
MSEATRIGAVTKSGTRPYRLAVAVLILAAAVTVTGLLAPPGHAAPAQKDEDVLPALLAEVKGLRAAMEQMASAGPRVQLFVGRLQLQEARINSMSRRLDTVRDALASAQGEYDRTRQQLKQIESAASSNAAELPSREEIQQMLPELRRQVAVAKAAVDRYAAEEAQLVSDLTTEQTRWSEINQRLDEQERALIKR